MWKIQSDNKGSGAGRSWPVAVVVGSRAGAWEIILFKNMKGRNWMCWINLRFLQGHSGSLRLGGAVWGQLTCDQTLSPVCSR